VGHENGRDVELALDLAQFHLHRRPQILVERRERLVEQQHRRIDNQRARQRDALLLTAGQLARRAICKSRQTHQSQHGFDADVPFLFRDAADLQTVGDITGDVHVRKQRVVLKHHADFPLVGRDVVHPLAADQDLAAVRAQESRGQIEQRGLAAAGGAEQGHELALPDRHRHTVKRGGFAESLGHGVEPDRAVLIGGRTLRSRVLISEFVQCSIPCQGRDTHSQQ
jgi:hypothetical protein